MSGSKKSDILYLFDRPGEPVYVPKGENRVAFQVPINYLPEHVQQNALLVRRTEAVREGTMHLSAEDTASKIPVKQLSLPDLSGIRQLEREDLFSHFIPKHQELAAQLIDIFLGMPTYDDFLSMSVYCRDRVNSDLFFYALSVAILHRPDTKDLPIPTLTEYFPNKFIDSKLLARARQEANVVPSGYRSPVEVDPKETGSNLDEEHRLAYWREDIGINLHHWHWHLVYPFKGDKKIVEKDRRGELFYYMHHQIIARYNTERLCNQLGRVKRFHNWREPITEGYFSKLNSSVFSGTWPARPAGAVLKDINRPEDQLIFDLQDLERWRDRIYEAIHTGVYINLQNEKVPLTELDGIDVLGNIMEASILSPNQNFYGNLHNLGHDAISYCHDPDHRYMETFSIMGSTATAMRDPIFYRFHAFVDDVFQEYKKTLPEYSPDQLDFSGVKIIDIEVLTPNQPANYLTTFWKKSDIELSYGLDFTKRGSILAKITHLDHSEFKYKIVANNSNKVECKGTVRIFMAPRQDERGLPFALKDQKEFMIEMDKFTVLLKPGENTIERKSTESSVTIQLQWTFRNLEENKPIGDNSPAQSNFCGCGWPQHMLIPKGKKEGFPMDLFIMISDYTGDAVEQDESPGCKNAVSYCGLRNRKYPDARPMGYPFDRRVGVKTLAQFLTGNMKVTQITIRHTDSEQPGATPSPSPESDN